jgi:hypothetical protein
MADLVNDTRAIGNNAFHLGQNAFRAGQTSAFERDRSPSDSLDSYSSYSSSEVSSPSFRHTISPNYSCRTTSWPPRPPASAPIAQVLLQANPGRCAACPPVRGFWNWSVRCANLPMQWPMQLGRSCRKSRPESPKSGTDEGDHYSRKRWGTFGRRTSRGCRLLYE